jgi:hypothetical protein
MELYPSKRDYSAATRERMAREGTAMKDGSFPIANETDLRNAIQSVGRASDYDAARRHIISRARALGLTEVLPDDWRKNPTGKSWGGIFNVPVNWKI